MLVIASLFVSTSASLPKTSYMKMIDVWMIFCFLLPFVVVILHTVVEYQGDLVTYGWKRFVNNSSIFFSLYVEKHVFALQRSSVPRPPSAARQPQPLCNSAAATPKRRKARCQQRRIRVRPSKVTKQEQQQQDDASRAYAGKVNNAQILLQKFPFFRANPVELPRILRRPHLNSGSINNRGGRTVPPPVV